MAVSQQPTYRAYVVAKREGADDFWINVGAAFAHQDGKGFNIILQAQPIDGKIVLREPQDEADQNTRRGRSGAASTQSGSRRR
jgi:hypothetical protein